MVIGGPPACIGSGMEAVHSPGTLGEFLRGTDSDRHQRDQEDCGTLKKAIETHP